MKIKAILIGASALTLLGAPAAFAQHHHNGGGGHHASAARHSGGSHRAQASHARRSATRHTTRRVTARHSGGHTVSRRAQTRHAASRLRGVRRTTVVLSSRIGGAQHWRHVTRLNGRWGRGSRLPVSYWRSHRWIDWRAHRLWAPPRGYNWVSVNGNYVLLAITTGIIADIVLANSYY